MDPRVREAERRRREATASPARDFHESREAGVSEVGDQFDGYNGLDMPDFSALMDNQHVSQETEKTFEEVLSESVDAWSSLHTPPRPGTEADPQVQLDAVPVPQSPPPQVVTPATRKEEDACCPHCNGSGRIPLSTLHNKPAPASKKRRNANVELFPIPRANMVKRKLVPASSGRRSPLTAIQNSAMSPATPPAQPTPAVVPPSTDKHLRQVVLSVSRQYQPKGVRPTVIESRGDPEAPRALASVVSVLPAYPLGNVRLLSLGETSKAPAIPRVQEPEESDCVEASPDHAGPKPDAAPPMDEAAVPAVAVAEPPPTVEPMVMDVDATDSASVLGSQDLGTAEAVFERAQALPPRKYRCTECGDLFHTVDGLMAHLEMHRWALVLEEAERAGAQPQHCQGPRFIWRDEQDGDEEIRPLMNRSDLPDIKRVGKAVREAIEAGFVTISHQNYDNVRTYCVVCRRSFSDKGHFSRSSAHEKHDRRRLKIFHAIYGAAGPRGFIDRGPLLENLLQICVTFQEDEVQAQREAEELLDDLAARCFIVWSDKEGCVAMPKYDFNIIFDPAVNVYDTLTDHDKAVVDLDREMLQEYLERNGLQVELEDGSRDSD